MENKLELSLGGEIRTLSMGDMGFLKNLGRVNTTNFDLLNTEYFSDPGKAYQAALIIVHAGLLNAGYKDLTSETVEEWLDKVPIESITDIHYAGIAAITRKTVDELKKVAAQAIAQNGASKVL
jgi:hypothetical protein